jgi:hypothetical protein
MVERHDSCLSCYRPPSSHYLRSLHQIPILSSSCISGEFSNVLVTGAGASCSRPGAQSNANQQLSVWSSCFYDLYLFYSVACSRNSHCSLWALFSRSVEPPDPVPSGADASHGCRRLSQRLRRQHDPHCGHSSGSGGGAAGRSGGRSGRRTLLRAPMPLLVDAFSC